MLNSKNSTTTPLSAGQTFTGEWQFAEDMPSIILATKTDQAGDLYLDFSPDRTNVDNTLTYSVAAGVNEVHRVTVTREYFRVRFTNTSASPQTYLRLQTLKGEHYPLSSPLNQTMQSDADAMPVRAVLHGENASGTFVKVPVDAFGHMQMAIHGPLLPFGSVHAERLVPMVQHDAVYGIDPIHQITTINASGGATASGSMFVCTTGASAGGAGSITSRRRVRYRPGQGIVAKFTGLFTSTGATNSYQIVGVGTAEDGLAFAIKDTTKGILHWYGGVREVRTLTVSTKSSHAENVTVRLNGTNFSVAVTNGSNTAQTAYEISRGTYTGWLAEAVGSTVVFIADSVGAKTSGTYTLTGTSAVGSFAQTKQGVAVTESFIPQASWNIDPMLGSGPSGSTMNWDKLNVFKIDLQYLGAGAVVFYVETASAAEGGEWVPVHVMLNPNALTAPYLINPCFQFQISAYSTGSTTPLTVKSASYGIFIEGEQVLIGNRFSFYAQSTAVGAANYQAIFTIQNTRYFNGQTNQIVVNLQSIAGALKHTSPCTIYVFRDATLAGAPNFVQYDTVSTLYWDTAATTCTITNNRQILWSGTLGDTGNFIYDFPDHLTLQPGESVTIAAKSSTGTPSYVTASLNTREDQ